ncbi:HdeD family acid-resistance protein [Nocardia puris]|uniref:HdeD family acid-resistance protein n=1 Tax=Nocardia puris TaxID=208602 RepID=UPI0008326FCD|nr:DUF308 domain-containing protein [Nocardia puris]
MPGNEGEGRVESRVRGGREVVLVAGLCSIALGVLMAVWPEKSVPTMELLFGLYLLMSGAAQMWLAFGAKFAVPLRLLIAVSAMLSIVMAVLCLRGGNSVPLLAMWVGLSLTVRGVVHATVAAWDDGLAAGGRHELFGLFSMVAGIVAIMVPLERLETLGFVIGGGLVVLGALEMLFGRVRVRAVTLPDTPRVAVPPN